MNAPRLILPLLCAAAACAWPAAAPAATRSVDEHHAAERNGQVAIQCVAGRVEVVGWDKPEVAVTGTVGPDVERVEVTGSGSQTTVYVATHGSHGLSLGWHGPMNGEAQIVVHVPAQSSVTATLVSADLIVSGVAGNQELHTVSGDIKAAVQREVRVRTVSGDIRLTAGADARLMELSTVSGDLNVSGGAGELTVNTVSGDGMFALGTLTRAHLKSVSGDISLEGGLAADGRLEAESVSGDLRIQFTGPLPPAAFDLESFSGDLSTCFGRKGVHEGYGPGTRLSFQEGPGSARVRVTTKSGDVTVCAGK